MDLNIENINMTKNEHDSMFNSIKPLPLYNKEGRLYFLSKDVLENIKRQLSLIPINIHRDELLGYDKILIHLLEKKNVLTLFIPMMNKGEIYLIVSDVHRYLSKFRDIKYFIILCTNNYATIDGDSVKMINKWISLYKHYFENNDAKYVKKNMKKYREDIGETLDDHNNYVDALRIFLNRMKPLGKKKIFNRLMIFCKKNIKKYKVNELTNDGAKKIIYGICNAYVQLFKQFLNDLYYHYYKNLKFAENIFLYLTNDDIDYNVKFNSKYIRKLIQKNNSRIKKYISEGSGIRIITITISHIDINSTTSHHSNYLIVIDNVIIRVEPNEKKLLYCSSSIRKFIRQIIPEDYLYIDNIVFNQPMQVGESREFVKYKGKKNKIYNMPSPLQGISGFCASWSFFMIMILLTNIDKSLINIIKYVSTFGLECIKIDKEMNYDDFMDVFNVFVENGDVYYFPYINDFYSTNYTLTKHYYLYYNILFCFYIMVNILKDPTYIDIYTGLDKIDKRLCDHYFSIFKEENTYQEVKKQIYFVKNKKLNVDNVGDIYMCSDYLFRDNENCVIDNIYWKPDNKCKKVDEHVKKICGQNKKCFKRLQHICVNQNPFYNPKKKETCVNHDEPNMETFSYLYKKYKKRILKDKSKKSTKKSKKSTGK